MANLDLSKYGITGVTECSLKKQNRVWKALKKVK